MSIAIYRMQKVAENLSRMEIGSFSRGDIVRGIQQGFLCRVISCSSCVYSAARTVWRWPVYALKLIDICNSRDTFGSKLFRVSVSVASLSLSIFGQIGGGLLGTIVPEFSFSCLHMHFIALLLRQCTNCASAGNFENPQIVAGFQALNQDVNVREYFRGMQNSPGQDFVARSIRFLGEAALHMTGREISHTDDRAPASVPFSEFFDDEEPEDTVPLADIPFGSHILRAEPDFDIPQAVPAGFFDPVVVRYPLLTQFFDRVAEAIPNEIRFLVEKQIYTRDEVEDMTTAMAAILNLAIFHVVTRNFSRNDSSSLLFLGKDVSAQEGGALYEHKGMIEKMLHIFRSLVPGEKQSMVWHLLADEAKLVKAKEPIVEKNQLMQELFSLIGEFRVVFLEKRMQQDSERWQRAFQLK